VSSDRPLRPGSLPARLAAQIVGRASNLKLPVGSHLAEQSLADELRVSRTPIRLALRLLSRMGVVEKRNNRGYFLKKAGETLTTAPTVPSDNEEDPLYFKIAEDRLAQRLDPEFSEVELLRRYGVTRTRILRLLSRMANEGWVSRNPGRGWEFQPVLDSLHAYEHAYRFRMLIEPAALREPGYEMEKATLQRLRIQQEKMLEGGMVHYSRFELFQIGSNFHEEIVNGSKNAFFVDGIRRVNRLRRLMEYHVHKDRISLISEYDDHLSLLKLIETKQLEEAAVFLHRHLANAMKKKLDIAGNLSLQEKRGRSTNGAVHAKAKHNRLKR
jgi:DNA-binding GntR family transcriptional regulator